MADIVDILVDKTEELVTIDVTTNETIVNISTINGSIVDSVNGQTGDVVLDADDIAETASRFWLTSALKTAYDSAVTWISTNGTNLLNHLSNTSNPHSTTATQVDALQRDGSNANSDVDLGAFSLNAKSLHAKGTAGAGHLGLKHQSSNATASASETSLFAGSDGELYYKNDGNAVQQLASQSFVNSGLATKENTITAGTTSQYYRGDKTFQTLNIAAVSGLQTALDAKTDETNWVDISLTSTIVGFSSFSPRSILYKVVDNIAFVVFYIEGISNSVNFTFTVPNNSTGGNSAFGSCGYNVNNNTVQTNPARILLPNNSNIVTISLNFLGGNYSASGTKACAGALIYKIN